MKQSLISIIVPIYKVEKYLEKCIESILAQTYKNIELILVDDGSPDNCPSICDRYAKKDSRVIVIHKQNGGLSDARNMGLNIAKGDFISFIDSDDFVSDDFCELLLGAIIRENADNGTPIVFAKPESPYTKAYEEIAAKVAKKLGLA